MKIALVAGGTLGHITPGLIIAKELSKKHDVIYITTKKDKRFTCFNDKDFLKQIYYVDSKGLSRKLFKNLSALTKNIKAYFEIRKILKEEKVDLVIGMGGYISGIAILCASLLKIKSMIHEQNIVMGLANKLVTKRVNKILLTYDIPEYNASNVYVVGNPSMFVERPNIYKQTKHILITSGSNGAKEINDLAIKLINNDYLSNYEITLVTGKKYYDEVIKNTIKKPNVNIIAFTNNMKEYIYKSSIIISRAGSSTISEAIGLNTIPLLIPSKNVKNDHQTKNALEVSRLGLGEVTNDFEELVDDVLKLIKRIENNKDIYLKNIKNYKNKYSLEKIISIIEGE